MRSAALLWLAALIAIIGMTGSLVAQQSPERPGSPVTHLRMLSEALTWYAADHRGFFPGDLSKLERYVRGSSAPSGWQFVLLAGQGTRVSQWRGGPLVLAVRNEGGGGGGGGDAGTISIAYLDGRVQTYVRANDADLEQRPVPPAAPVETAADPVAVETALTPAAAALAGAAVTRPAPPATAPSGDVADNLIGAWNLPVGGYLATYRFERDGTFTLEFALDPEARPGQPLSGLGKSAGTWRLEGGGRRIVMTNTASSTPFTVVGEREEADVDSLSADSLVLRTTNRKGQTERVKLARAAPFVKGQRDNDKIVGTWTREGGQVLVLADSGLAVMAPYKGEWAQRGQTLTLVMEPMERQGAGMGAADARAGAGAAMRARPGAAAGRPPTRQEWQIDLVDETTLVLTRSIVRAGRPEPPMTLTFLRAK